MYGNPQTLLNQPSAAQNAGGNSGPLNSASVSEAAVDVNASAVSGSLQFFIDRLGIDGVWYQIWSGAAITVAGAQSASIGPGLATAASLGTAIRLRWTLSGTATFSASIIGK